MKLRSKQKWLRTRFRYRMLFKYIDSVLVRWEQALQRVWHVNWPLKNKQKWYEEKGTNVSLRENTLCKSPCEINNTYNNIYESQKHWVKQTIKENKQKRKQKTDLKGYMVWVHLHKILKHESMVMNNMKRYDTERWTPQVCRCPICYWRRVEK